MTRRQIKCSGDVGQIVVTDVGRCAPVGERFSVNSPSGMLDFFVHASDEVHRYISRLTGGDESLTEDIVQDTFVTLLRHHRSGDDSVMSVGWLITAARHRLIDHVRSLQREQARLERAAAGVPHEMPPIEPGSISSDQARWMLSQLPIHERVALAMHTLDGMSVAEVADELDRS